MGDAWFVRVPVLAAAVVVLTTTMVACASGDDTPAAESSAPETSSPTPSASEGPPAAVDDIVPAAGAVGLGVPSSAVPPDDSGSPGAGWTAADGLLYVVTFGSSTCPLLTEPDATESGGTVTVAFVPLPDGPCTMDFVPTTSVVQVPSSVDQSAPVPVDLGGAGTVTVEPRPSSDEAGPIAWAAPTG